MEEEEEVSNAASEQDEEQAGNDGEGANDMVVVDLKVKDLKAQVEHLHEHL
jgi:hypothetical protein